MTNLDRSDIMLARHVRRLRAVHLRNIEHPSVSGPIDCYLTVHIGASQCVAAVSLLETCTLNPEWTLPSETFEPEDRALAPLSVSDVVLRVWKRETASSQSGTYISNKDQTQFIDSSSARSSTANCFCAVGPSGLDCNCGSVQQQSCPCTSKWFHASMDKMLFEERVDLGTLVAVSANLASVASMPPNALAFQFENSDKFFARYSNFLDSESSEQPRIKSANSSPIPPIQALPSHFISQDRSPMLQHQNAPFSPQKNSLSSQSLSLPPLALPAPTAPLSVKSNSENVVSINNMLNSAKKISSGLSQLSTVADANQSAVIRISASIESRSEACTQSRQIELRRARVDQLNQTLQSERKQILQERIRICEARQHLLPLAQSILLQSIMVQEQRARKSNAALRSDELRSLLNDSGLAVRLAQRRVLSEICQIFPISLSIAGAMSLGSHPTSMVAHAAALVASSPCIRGLALPSVVSQLIALGDEHASTAIGYAAHLVVLLAKLWDIPLRYRVLCQGSRSVIVDDVAGVELPLFIGEVERVRFESAWLLLARNIDQLARVRSEQVKSVAEGADVDVSALSGFPVLEGDAPAMYPMLEMLDYLMSVDLPR